jgi:hypothetical protein
MRYKPKPAAATPAPEPPATEEDTTLPDPTPPKPQQPEASAGGEEQVEATDAAPADGIGKRLTSHG